MVDLLNDMLYFGNNMNIQLDQEDKINELCEQLGVSPSKFVNDAVNLLARTCSEVGLQHKELGFIDPQAETYEEIIIDTVEAAKALFQHLQ